VIAAAVLAVVLLATFVRVQARGRTPLMPLRLFRNRAFSGAVVVILVFGLTMQAVPYFLTLYFQDILGFNALETGLAFLGPTLSITVGNFLSERLTHRFGTRNTLASGVASTALQVGTAAGLAVLVAVANHHIEGLSGQALRAASAEGMSAAVYVLGAVMLTAVLAARRLPGPRARVAAATSPAAD
jgi:Na+/melibiose symporter-like transporter